MTETQGQISVAVIVTAAGKGTRFSSDTNKLFLEVDGKPLIVFTILSVLHAFTPDQTIVTVHPDDKVHLQHLLKKYGISDRVQLVEGSDTRRKSVENGFWALNPCDVVMIHDGARPYISRELINRLLHAASLAEAVVPGIEISDTVKRVVGEHCTETIPRECLRRIQTPQLFPYEQLRVAYRHGIALHATDEAMMMEEMGVPVRVVPGEVSNKKITVPTDWLRS